jgi:hypothetical protein
MNATLTPRERARLKLPISAAQMRCIYAQLRQLALTDEAASIVHAFTARRTTSVKQMNSLEASELIAHLKNQNPQEARATAMRNKILSMAHDLGWHKPGTTQVDMQHVNNWCCTYGYGKKKLDAYTYAELPELVSQFEILYKQQLNKL